MTLSRRRFLNVLTGTLAASSAVAVSPSRAAGATAIQAVAFDGFALFDPGPAFALAETLFPGKGAELANAWRSRQFEYQWLRALGGRYADFWTATADALTFAASRTGIALERKQHDALMHTFLTLEAWPDVQPVLHELKGRGYRLMILSNMSGNLLDRAIVSSHLEARFEHVISTDRIRSYKPDPRAYALATAASDLAPTQIAFVAFAGWDAAGAKWYGYPTYWVNRVAAPAEQLDAAPDATAADLSQLPDFVRSVS